MGSCEGATLKDHREHHRGMCNSRSCRPLLSLGRKRFQATTTKTTPFERKWKWKEAKERDTAGTGCGRGWSIKTVVFEMGLCLKSPCCPDPCHTATFAGWCVTCTPQTHPVTLVGHGGWMVNPWVCWDREGPYVVLSLLFSMRQSQAMAVALPVPSCDHSFLATAKHILVRGC